ncbi:MAG: EamA family transporter [Spirochaetes bacterium]|nr:EamA family transporter [Spirochaetota bacterium]
MTKISGKWLISLSAVAFSISGVFTKLASVSMSFWETVFFRGVFGLISLLFVIKISGTKIKAVNKPKLLLRGILGTLALLCIFYAIKYSSLTKGVMLMYTFPIYAAIFSRLFFKEKSHILFWPILAVGFTGIVVVLNPDFTQIVFADLVGFFGGIFAGGAITMVRELRKTDTPNTIYLWFMIVILFVTLPFFVSNIKNHKLLIWLYAVGIGIFTTAGQLLMTKGYRVVSAGIGSAISLQGLILTALFGWIMGEILTWRIILGGVLIIISGIMASNLPAKNNKV